MLARVSLAKLGTIQRYAPKPSEFCHRPSRAAFNKIEGAGWLSVKLCYFARPLASLELRKL